MKHILGISLLLLIALQGFSQDIFKEGKIIKSEGDTIYGLIKFAGDNVNAVKCVFKKDAGSTSQEYLPGDISGYWINNKYYVSRIITKEGKQQPVFLEYLIDGTVDVYYLFDGFSDCFYIDGGDGQLVELVQKSEIVNTNHVQLYLPGKKYIGVLKYIFRESPKIVKQAETTSLERKSLINIAHDYHNEMCPDEECIIYEKKKIHANIKFGFLAGLGFVNVVENNNLPNRCPYYKDCDFEPALSPFAGVFMNANVPSINPHIYFYYQITLSQLNLNSNITSQGMTYTNVNDISISQSFVSNEALFKYEFRPLETVRPHIFAGGFFNLGLLYGYSRKYRISATSSDHVYAEGEATDDFDPFSHLLYGPAGGAGIVFETPRKKAITIDFQYQRGTGYVEFMKFNNYMISLGYQF